MRERNRSQLVEHALYVQLRNKGSGSEKQR